MSFLLKIDKINIIIKNEFGCQWFWRGLYVLVKRPFPELLHTCATLIVCLRVSEWAAVGVSAFVRWWGRGVCLKAITTIPQSRSQSGHATLALCAREAALQQARHTKGPVHKDHIRKKMAAK